MELSKEQSDAIVSKHVDSSISEENIRNILNFIQESADRNNLKFTENEAQFIADFTQIVSKFAAKSAVVATINTLNDLQKWCRNVVDFRFRDICVF